MQMRKSVFFWHPNGDPDHSQNLMGSKLDKDNSHIFSDGSKQLYLRDLAN